MKPTKGDLIIIGCYLFAFGTIALLSGWRPKIVRNYKMKKADKMVKNGLAEEYGRSKNATKNGITMEELLKQIEVINE